MILTDYNEEETMRRFKEEYFEDGVAVGRQEGLREGRQEGRQEGLQEGRQSILDQLVADGKLTPTDAECYKTTTPSKRHTGS